MRVVLFIGSLFFALAAGPAWADEVKTTSSCTMTKRAEKMCSFEILIEGEITSATVTSVRQAIAERDQMMKREGGLSDLWMIRINSLGGGVNAAIEIGRLLRSMDAPIEVRDDEICASACVLVLGGATHRILRGRVGIHRPYFEAPATNIDVGQVQKAYGDMKEKIRSYFREMNISDRLADDLMIVPPEKMRFLSLDELVQYGLGIIDPASAEAGELEEVKKLGISRAEYMRRKSLSEALCKKSNPDTGETILSLECKNAVFSGKQR
jgi:ATP-dependent protease ClpP protease subunit